MGNSTTCGNPGTVAASNCSLTYDSCVGNQISVRCVESPTTFSCGNQYIASIINISNTIIPNGHPITDVNVWARFNHTYVGDVEGGVFHNGNGRKLFNPSAKGCSNDGFHVIFDDSSSGPVIQNGTACDSTVPPAYRGTHQPVDALSYFNGDETNGEWKLEIQDAVVNDDGIFYEWGIALTVPSYCTDSPTPFPSFNPTYSPSKFPTIYTINPTLTPSKFPTDSPSKFPTNIPTLNPSLNPSLSTNHPSILPSKYPTKYPSVSTSKTPTQTPTAVGAVIVSTNAKTDSDDEFTAGVDNTNSSGNEIVMILSIMIAVLVCIVGIMAFIMVRYKSSKNTNKYTDKDIITSTTENTQKKLEMFSVYSNEGMSVNNSMNDMDIVNQINQTSSLSDHFASVTPNMQGKEFVEQTQIYSNENDKIEIQTPIDDEDIVQCINTAGYEVDQNTLKEKSNVNIPPRVVPMIANSYGDTKGNDIRQSVISINVSGKNDAETIGDTNIGVDIVENGDTDYL